MKPGYYDIQYRARLLMWAIPWWQHSDPTCNSFRMVRGMARQDAILTSPIGLQSSEHKRIKENDASDWQYEIELIEADQHARLFDLSVTGSRGKHQKLSLCILHVYSERYTNRSAQH